MPLFQGPGVVQGGRDMPRRRMDHDMMLLEDTWSAPTFGGLQEEFRTEEAATEQFFNQATSRSRPATTSQSSSRRPALFLSHDGHNSPEDEQFPPQPGFRRAQGGLNRVSASANPFQLPRGPVVQKSAQREEPEQPLTEAEQRALRLLQGPPPDMPGRLMRAEDRKKAEQRQSQPNSSAVNGRQNVVRRLVTAQRQAAAAPKPQNKDLLHQLVRPSGVSKTRPATHSNPYQAGSIPRSGPAPTNTGPVAPPNGYLPNGRRRLPPLSVSAELFYKLKEQALRNQTRISLSDFAIRQGYPPSALLRAVGPHKVVLIPDPSSSHQKRPQHLPGNNVRGSMQPNSTYGINKPTQAPRFTQQHVQQPFFTPAVQAISFDEPSAAPAPRPSTAFKPFNSARNTQRFNKSSDPITMDDPFSDFGVLRREGRNGSHQTFMANLPPSFPGVHKVTRAPTIPSPTPVSRSLSKLQSTEPVSIQGSRSQQQFPLPALQQLYPSYDPFAALDPSLPLFSQQQAGSSSANAVVVPDDDEADENWDMDMGIGMDLVDPGLAAGVSDSNIGDAYDGNIGNITNTNTNANDGNVDSFGNLNVNTNANTSIDAATSLGSPILASKNGPIIGYLIGKDIVSVEEYERLIEATVTGIPETAVAINNATPANAEATFQVPPIGPTQPDPLAPNDVPMPDFSDLFDFNLSSSSSDKENEPLSTPTVLHPIFNKQPPPTTPTGTAEEQPPPEKDYGEPGKSLDSYLLAPPEAVRGFSIPHMLGHWDEEVSRRAMMRAGEGGRFLDEDDEAVGEGGEGEKAKAQESSQEVQGMDVAAGGVDGHGEGEMSYEERTRQFLRENGDDEDEEDSLF